MGYPIHRWFINSSLSVWNKATVGVFQSSNESGHPSLSSWLIVIPMKSYHIYIYSYIYIHINPQVMGLTSNLTIEIQKTNHHRNHDESHPAIGKNTGLFRPEPRPLPCNWSRIWARTASENLGKNEGKTRENVGKARENQGGNQGRVDRIRAS